MAVNWFRNVVTGDSLLAPERAVDFEVMAWMLAASNGIVFFGGSDLDSILKWVTTF